MISISNTWKPYINVICVLFCNPTDHNALTQLWLNVMVNHVGESRLQNTRQNRSHFRSIPAQFSPVPAGKPMLCVPISTGNPQCRKPVGFSPFRSRTALYYVLMTIISYYCQGRTISFRINLWEEREMKERLAGVSVAACRPAAELASFWNKPIVTWVATDLPVS